MPKYQPVNGTAWIRPKETRAVFETPLLQCLSDRQAEFAEAILDPERPVPIGLIGPRCQPSAKRFAVYRNNVVLGLIETLKAAYPVVHRLVGEAFFAAMARLYVRAHPPASPIMLKYGESFPAFIAHFEPAAGLAYLPDVARLERRWVEAYHAADASPLPPSTLGRLPTRAFPFLRFLLHPSLRILRSRFPIVSIWQAHIGGDLAESIDLNDGGEDAVITRPEAEVEIRRLPPGAAAFIAALLAGSPLLKAAAEGLRAAPSFDLTQALGGMIEARMIIGYDTQPSPVMEAL